LRWRLQQRLLLPVLLLAVLKLPLTQCSSLCFSQLPGRVQAQGLNRPLWRPAARRLRSCLLLLLLLLLLRRRQRRRWELRCGCGWRMLRALQGCCSSAVVVKLPQECSQAGGCTVEEPTLKEVNCKLQIAAFWANTTRKSTSRTRQELQYAPQAPPTLAAAAALHPPRRLAAG
jgi:hypothetical protein